MALSNIMTLIPAHVLSKVSKGSRLEEGKYVTSRCLEKIYLSANRSSDLEISKPQKNTRNAAATAAGDNLRAGFNRRSRSPDYGRGAQVWTGGQRGGADRFDRSTVSNHSERRVRDDYRPMRSPSPRGFRGRDDFRGGRERSPDRYFRGRSRSPFDRTGQYRVRSPRLPDPDDEANLPIARRNPQDVPDVQMVLVDEVDRYGVSDLVKIFANGDM